MKVNNPNALDSFDEIFTSEDPDPQADAELSRKTYIRFKITNQDFINDLLHDPSFGKYPILNIDQHAGAFLLTVTGDRKVAEIISHALKFIPKKENSHLTSSLVNFSGKLSKKLKTKPIKNVPSKSKDLSTLVEVKYTLDKTANQNVKMENKSRDEQYIYKKNLSGRNISNLEVFNGFCFRLLLGNRHPKMWNAHLGTTGRKGVLSEMFSNYESFYDKYKDFLSGINNDKPTAEILLNSEAIKVWVAAYVEEENDLHGGNFGFSNGFCVKIDDDQATWPLTSKYSRLDPQCAEPLLGHLVAPIKSFPVTSLDIIRFPYIKDAKPRNWLYEEAEAALFEELTKILLEKKFIEDKYYMFLKRILIPDEVYKGIGIATIDNDKKRQEFVAHKCKKTAELKHVLLNISSFQYYINTNTNIIKKIISEFEEFNKDYPNDKDLKVSIDKIKANFAEIQKITQPKLQKKMSSKLSQEPKIQHATSQNVAIADRKDKNVLPHSFSKKINFETVQKRQPLNLTYAKVNAKIKLFEQIIAENKADTNKPYKLLI